MKKFNPMNRWRIQGAIAALALATAATAQQAAPPAASAPAGPAPQPPANVQAHDFPWDGGEQVVVTWAASPDEGHGVAGYHVYWKYAPDSLKALRIEALDRAGYVQEELTAHPDSESWKKSKQVSDEKIESLKSNSPKLAGIAKPDAHKFTVDQLEPGIEYIFSVTAFNDSGVESAPVESSPTAPIRQYFAGDRLWVAIIEFVICSAVVSFIVLARKGFPLKIRKIAGLEAVSEAVGRATEMGRPVLFVPGIQDMNDIQTIAGMTVLGSVAKTAAEYDARIEVPTSKSLVMTAARETTQSAYLAAGRPDAYNSDKIYYVTDEQFGYVAYLTGHMAREKPAACFYMGAFFAESLILAETGNSIGAIQIAGTAEPSQLPFFVAACDYTLIGEEFFAASAYLSGEPDQLGSLKGQDIGKMIVGAGLIVGCLIATAAEFTPGFKAILEFITGTMLR